MSPPPTDVIQARERLACDSHESMSPPPTDVIQERECLACEPPPPLMSQCHLPQQESWHAALPQLVSVSPSLRRV